MPILTLTDSEVEITGEVCNCEKCQKLKEEMEKVCGAPVSVGNGKLVVAGNFHARIKMWLSGLGF